MRSSEFYVPGEEALRDSAFDVGVACTGFCKTRTFGTTLGLQNVNLH